MNASLDRRLRALVSSFGLQQVRKALNEIAAIERRPSPNTDGKKQSGGSTTRAKRQPLKTNRYVARACANRPDARHILEKLGSMYREQSFLTYLSDVGTFLHEHGVDENPSSRPEGLKRVMEILASLPVAELEKVLRKAEHRHKIGDFRMLANAIMGLPDE